MTTEYVVGHRFTAADTQLGSAVADTMGVMKVLPERPAFRDYLVRLVERPAYARATAKDRELAMASPSLTALMAKRPEG